MTPAQALSVEAIWQQWERRIVNARFPLLQYLGGSRYSAFYLTDFNGTKAALKLIPVGTPRASAQVACWKTASRLSHPNLLRIHDAGLWHADQEQDMYFAVMEYCDESLADLLRQRQLSPAEARDVLNPTLGVLKYLHSHGMLHGQVKPAHLLASGDQLKLSCDTIHRNGEAHPSGIESPYDAPEKSAGTISLSGDVWSLGITLYEALTGHLPGAGKTNDAKIGEKLPAPFDVIVSGCLARDRDKRLSLSAIRAILDKPVKEAAVEPKVETQAAEKSASKVIVLPTSTRPDASTSRMEVLRPAAATSELADIDAEKSLPPSRTMSEQVATIQPVLARISKVIGNRRTSRDRCCDRCSAGHHPRYSVASHRSASDVHDRCTSHARQPARNSSANACQLRFGKLAFPERRGTEPGRTRHRRACAEHNSRHRKGEGACIGRREWTRVAGEAGFTRPEFLLREAVTGGGAPMDLHARREGRQGSGERMGAPLRVSPRRQQNIGNRNLARIAILGDLLHLGVWREQVDFPPLRSILSASHLRLAHFP